jgi:hypothetical protein
VEQILQEYAICGKRKRCKKHHTPVAKMGQQNTLEITQNHCATAAQEDNLNWPVTYSWQHHQEGQGVTK